MSVLLLSAGADPQREQQALHGMAGLSVACSKGQVPSQGSSVSIRLSRLPLFRPLGLLAQVAKRLHIKISSFT